jgi:hypothetical protein
VVKIPAMRRGTAAMLGALVLLQLLATAPVRAQRTISDGPVKFTREAFPFDTTPATEFIGVSADPMDNHVPEMGWWYRVTGDAAEKFFPTPNFENYAGDTSTLNWNNVDSRGFRAVERAVVEDGGGPSGQVLFTLTVTNLSATTALGIDVFNMTDIDLGDPPDGDTGQLVNANDRIGVIRGSDTAEYGAQGANAFLVLPYDSVPPNLNDVAGKLNDAAANNFDNSGLPFGPDDITAGFQWSTTVIPPSGSATFIAGIAVNMPLTFPPSSTTTTTSSTLATVTTTTSTTLATELCDNCFDDDGDALLDFEDGDCCAAAPLTLGKSRLRPRDAGTATVKLKAKLAASPVADSSAQDLTLQLRGAGATLCARFPAATLVRRRNRLSFRDVDGAIASARGITAVTIKEKKQGAKVAVFGPAAELAVLGPGAFTLTLGFRDPATAETTNACAAGTATFRPARRGIRFP